MLPKLVVVLDSAGGLIIDLHLLVFRGKFGILFSLDGFLVLKTLVDADVCLSIGVFLIVSLAFY